MKLQTKILISPEENREMIQYLSRTMSISHWLAGFLVNRGLLTPPEASFFLFGQLEDLPSPFELEDMEKAAKRILKALAEKEKILIYGDYDADGITSTALLTRFLRDQGGEVVSFLPRREREGYGLDEKVIKRAGQEGVQLLITVDCGSKDAEEVELAQSLGMEVIITDHHQVEELPRALAVINPHRRDNRYPYPQLAGVGVAFKVAQAVQELKGEKDLSYSGLRKLLPLVAVGTVADMVPLREENRVLVRAGLREMDSYPGPGLQALLQQAGMVEKINSGNIAFGLAPRLNAAGRLKTAGLALELLLTGDKRRAQRLSVVLDRLNSRRRGVEEQIVSEARQVFLEREQDKILVAASPRWNPGVIGIAASRLVEEFSRPVLLIGLEEKEGKGSGRSVPGFNLYQALKQVEDCLIRYGGHPMAAGFAIAPAQVEQFSEKINEYARENLPQRLLKKRITIEGLLELEQTDYNLLADIEKLAPFGAGNPRPLFGNESLLIQDKKQVGQRGNHLKLRLGPTRQGIFREAIAFGMGNLFPDLKKGSDYQFVFAPRSNEWNGRKQIQLEIKDIAPDYIREKKHIPRQDWGSCKIIRTRQLEQGRQHLLEMMTGELKENRRPGIYLAPTLYRLARAFQACPGGIEKTILTGFHPRQLISSALQSLESRQPFILFLSLPLFYYFYNNLSSSGIYLGWESPFPDFPPATFYNFLGEKTPDWKGFFGLELAQPDWDIPFSGVQEMEKGGVVRRFILGNKEEIGGENPVPFYLFSREKRRELKPGAKKLLEGWPGKEEGYERIRLGDLPSSGGEFISFLDKWAGDTVFLSGSAGPLLPPSRKIDRETLARTYLHLASKGEAQPLDELISSWSGEAAVLKESLRIMEELQLISISFQQGEKLLKIRETSGGNVDLFRSLRYNEFVNEREAYHRWFELWNTSFSSFIKVLGGQLYGDKKPGSGNF